MLSLYLVHIYNVNLWTSRDISPFLHIGCLVYGCDTQFLSSSIPNCLTSIRSMIIIYKYLVIQWYGNEQIYQQQCELRVRFSTSVEIVKIYIILSCFAQTLKNITFKLYVLYQIELSNSEHNAHYIIIIYYSIVDKFISIAADRYKFITLYQLKRIVVIYYVIIL